MLTKRICFFAVFISMSLVLSACKADVLIEREGIGSLELVFPQSAAGSTYKYEWSLNSNSYTGPYGTAKEGEKVLVDELRSGKWNVGVDVYYKDQKIGSSISNSDIKQGEKSVFENFDYILDRGIFFISYPFSGNMPGDVVFTDGSKPEPSSIRVDVDGSQAVIIISEALGKTIHNINIGGSEFLIGRSDDGKPIHLNFDKNGALAFREHDENGFIPVGHRSELANIGANLSGYYILEADIDLQGGNEGELKRNWEAIARSEGERFSGIFDGAGYEISNMFIDASGAGAYGLFGNVEYVSEEEPGILRNINLVSGEINLSDSVSNCAGSICAKNAGGLVSNCVSGVNITGGGILGGICGINGDAAIPVDFQTASGKGIELCQNIGVITSTAKVERGHYIGGIAGKSYSLVYASANVGDISGNAEFMGGVVGYNYMGAVTACVNSAEVTNTIFSATVGAYAGGVEGAAYSTDTASNGITRSSYNRGQICGVKVGGVVGYSENAFIRACYNSGILMKLLEKQNPDLPESELKKLSGWSSQYCCGISAYANKKGSVPLFYNCYWNWSDDGEVYTIPAFGYNLDDSWGSVNAKMFGDLAGVPSQRWPTRDMSGWELYNSDSPPPDSGYWRNLGSYTSGVFPVLYFEKVSN